MTLVRYTYWYCMYVVIIGMTLVVVACIVQAYGAVNESRGLLTGTVAPQDRNIKPKILCYSKIESITGPTFYRVAI